MSIEFVNKKKIIVGLASFFLLVNFFSFPVFADDPTPTPDPFCAEFPDDPTCITPTPSPTATPTPYIFPTVSPVTNVEIASSSAVSYVIYNGVNVMYNIGLIVAIYCGAKLGLWAFSL